MNPMFEAYKFPAFRCSGFEGVLPRDTHPDCIDLMRLLMQYEPDKRPAALAALTHPYFDELRTEDLILPDGTKVPDLFDFTEEEKRTVTPDVIMELTPNWYTG